MSNAAALRPSLRQFALIVAIAYFLAAAVLTGRVSDLIRLFFADLAGLALLTIGMAAVAILVLGMRRYPQRQLESALIFARQFLRDRATARPPIP